MNETTESVSSADLGSLVEQVLLDSSAKGKLGAIPSTKRKLGMDEQTGEKAAPSAPKARSRSKKTLVQLNPASRASGRPKQKASFKKAKKAKDTEETMVFVDDIVTIGDVTLENFEDADKKKVLSIAEIGDTLSAIRRMFDSAVFKRPKAFVVSSKPAQVLETDLRFVLAESLVVKRLDSAKNVKIREELINERSVTASIYIERGDIHRTGY
ncbi:hypothetical protein PC129_g12518 [Phytophthora cactorum]|uniref:Uncharacterized protein n=1 Tax=Phytophthora cactorum TaxID=29920 RepID=A0A8T0YVI5_9STRA|nr:hypothetical protein Pcac1_g6120 [Phytophthora cactorum]KAG2816870.1 hypothetical protein PC112_g13277 [Phytophthora cactorum]KAG2818438.1 hypothetical protein PC111_g12298 [Phytophthora cactorum]KAG2853652.1 hypothetical protein PC113_g13979 [Phytophthora cactorum]KAG2897121.1 hypothetical protein PC114_g14800 [Phytophthora cactorum]